MGLPLWIITSPIYVFLSSVWIINFSLKLGYEGRMYTTNIFFIDNKGFCSISVHLKLTLVEHHLFGGYSVCACLRHISL